MASSAGSSASRRVPAVLHPGLPWWTRIVFVALAAAVVGLTAHGLIGVGGEGIHNYLDAWVSCTAEVVAALICAVGALRVDRNRGAWVLIAIAMGLWAIGDIIWALRGEPDASVTISDAFWLAWYPLLVVALALLVRDRVPGFELHRWIDGVVVMLVIVTPWVALFLQPAAEHSHDSSVIDVVDFAYPLGDAIIVGAMLGVLALMGWQAGVKWLTLVIAFSALAIADAVYSLDALGHTYSSDTVFDAMWLGGMLLIAYAAWLPHTGRSGAVAVYGWKAIALPLAAQIFAVALQIYGLFFYVPIAERILTIVVLLIAIVQIVVSRPRAPETLQLDDVDG